MSKIGKKPIIIPDQVKIKIEQNQVIVTGPQGELKTSLLPGISVEIKDNQLSVNRNKDNQQSKAFHGLIRSLIKNNVLGVSEGYKKTLKLIGTGYRVKKKGQGLEMTVGFSHSVEFNAISGVMLEIEGEDTIHVSGIDKQLVGQVAANIRSIKPPEPYQGKGIRYEDEVIKLKPGKQAAE